MRVIVMYDVPVENSAQRREYRVMHKYFEKAGFIQIQKSVYAKLAINPAQALAIENDVKKHKPKEGNLSMITITEKQFSGMEYIIGERQSVIVDSDERVIFL